MTPTATLTLADAIAERPMLERDLADNASRLAERQRRRSQLDEIQGARMAQQEHLKRLQTPAAMPSEDEFLAQEALYRERLREEGQAARALQEFDAQYPDLEAQRDALEPRQREFATAEKFEERLKPELVPYLEELQALGERASRIQALVDELTLQWPSGSEPRLLDVPVPTLLQLRSVCWPAGIFVDGPPLLRRGPSGGDDEHLPRVSCARWLVRQLCVLLGEPQPPQPGPNPRIVGTVDWFF